MENKTDAVSDFRRASVRGAKISPLHAVGVACVDGDVLSFVGETTILYKVGSLCCTYDIEEKYMRFFPKSAKVKDTTSLSVSPGNKLVAMCETFITPQQQNINQVSVYHISKTKRMRTLAYPTNASLGTAADAQHEHRFELCAFSGDSKFLVTTSGDSEGVLMYWKWESEKLVAHGKGAANVSCVRMHPKDSSIVTTSGPGNFRQWRLGSDFSLKYMSVLPSKLEHQKFADHMWTEESSVILATEAGIVYVLEMNADNALEIRQSIAPPDTSSHLHVESISAFNRGFMVCGGHGHIGVYERIDERNEPFMYAKSISSKQHQHFSSIAISSHNETAVLYASTNELVTLPIHNIDSFEGAEATLLPLHSGGFHVGPVACLDVCDTAPLVVTAGKDNLVRILNYDTWTCSIAEVMSEDVFSVAIHPSSYFLLVSVRDRVKIFARLVDRLKLKHEIVANKVRDVRFASGGHYFACASGISVLVYSTYQRNLLCTFVGHIGPVKRVLWSAEDRVLLSAGNDGCVYAWDMISKGKLEHLSHAVSSCQQNGMVIGRDLQHMVTCGSDSMLREVSGGEQSYEVELSQNHAIKSTSSSAAAVASATNSKLGVGTQSSSKSKKTGSKRMLHVATEMALHPNESAVFVGMSTGAIRVYDWPISANEGAFSEFLLHSGPITKLRFSRDGRKIFSASDDGTLIASNITCAESKENTSLTSLGIAQSHQDEDVLVGRDDLEESARTLDELRKKLEDLKSDYEYEAHVKETEWSDVLKRQKEESESALKLEVNHFEKLQSRHEETVRANIEELERINAEHIKVTQELSNDYEHKLSEEMNRYDALSEAMERMRQRCESLLEEQESQHRTKVVALNENSAKEISELTAKLNLSELNVREERARSDAMLQQQESEYELEILHLKHLREGKEDDSMETIAKLQNQLNQESNKRNKLNSRISEMKASKREDEKKMDALRNEIDDLRIELRRTEKSLEERDATLSDKEQIIAKLRKQNQTLEHFRFVLDHRIAKLEAEKGPVNAEIENLRKATDARDSEFAVEFHAKKERSKEVHALHDRAETLTNEIKLLRGQVREKRLAMVSLYDDLESVCKIPNAKEVTAEVKKLVKSLRASEHFAMDRAHENQAHKSASEEIKRQQQFMHDTIASLKRSMRAAEAKLQAKTLKNVEENSLLVNECNELRRRTVVQERKIQALQQKLKRNATSTRSTRSPSQSPLSGKVNSGASGSTNARSVQSLLAEDERSEMDAPARSVDSPTCVDLDDVFDASSSRNFPVKRGKPGGITSEEQAKDVISQLLRQLDESNREIEMQRGEIRRLRAGMVTEYLAPIGRSSHK